MIVYRCPRCDYCVRDLNQPTQDKGDGLLVRKPQLLRHCLVCIITFLHQGEATRSSIAKQINNGDPYIDKLLDLPSLEVLHELLYVSLENCSVATRLDAIHKVKLLNIPDREVLKKHGDHRYFLRIKKLQKAKTTTDQTDSSKP